MGQQQLLLLVLATVIVGLATVAGIQAFDQNQTQANGDALSTTALEIASEVQAWSQKPSQLGGGGTDWSGSDLTAPTLSELVYGSDPYETSNGNKFTITSDCSGSSATVGNSPKMAVHGVNAEYGNDVCVVIEGPGSEDIETGLSLANESVSITTE